MRRASLLIQKGRIREAATAADQALSLDQRDARLWHNGGLIAEQSRDLALAESRYRQAAALDARLWEAREALALLLSRTGRAHDGLLILDTLMTTAPAGARLRRNAAVAALRAGRPSLALTYLPPELPATSQREEEVVVIALCELADSLLLVRRPAEALAAAARALALDSTAARNRLLCARGALALDRMEEAETHARAALAADPQCCEALLVLAHALASRGQLADSDSTAAAAAACVSGPAAW